MFYIFCVFVDLGIKHAMRMRLITLSSVVCPPLQYFSTLFSKKLLKTKRVFLFSLQNLSETFFVLRRTERNMIKKCILVFKYSIRYSCQILVKLEFFHHIFEKCSNMSNV
jgi:hypothetical protein